MNKKIIGGVAAIIGIIAIPLWSWFAVPALTKIPSDFSYKANIISLDNFYDEARGEYSGEKRSVTTFYYEAVAQDNGVLTIKNVFDVRKVTGEKIFSSEHLFGIDSLTGKHVASFGDRDRDGYLFAPRMKGLFRQAQDKEPFVHWNYGYDLPAHMTFAGEENLLGLPVYRYETRYEGAKIDLTANLSFLPGVGKTRGVILEPYIELWIEPTTGYLVKWEESSDAYYFYDLKTGQKTNPYNNFSNKYTRESIAKQVSLAKGDKLKLIIFEIIIPLLLVLIALSLFIGISRKKIAWIVLILGIVALGAYTTSRVYTSTPQEMVKIGIARWSDNSEFDKNIDAFKQALTNAGFIEGKNITYFVENPHTDVEKQKIIINSFVAKKVDLIYTLTTPSTLIAKELVSDIPIVFTIVTYPVETGVIASLNNSRNNLVGTRNWVPVSEQVSVFRELIPSFRTIGFVHRRGEPNSTFQYKEMVALGKGSNFEVVDVVASDLNELSRALDSVTGKVDSLFLSCDTLIAAGGEEIVIAFANKQKLPSFSCNPAGIHKGSLVGTVADFAEIGKLAGEKAALILEGVTPQSLETTSVARPFIYINKKTADTLGIIIPQSLIIKAKEIIK